MNNSMNSNMTQNETQNETQDEQAFIDAYVVSHPDVAPVNFSRLRKDLTGKVFSRLTALRPVLRNKGGIALYLCRCECDQLVITQAGNLISGHTLSCGCYNIERVRERLTTHGLRDSSEYATWNNMKDRCLNQNNPQFQDYGGRGISIYDEWINSFEAFYEHIGPKTEPKSMYSIDRIDNNGGYEPGNVRWATAKQQAANRRRKKNSKRILQIEMDGTTTLWDSAYAIRSELGWSDYHITQQAKGLRKARGLYKDCAWVFYD